MPRGTPPSAHRASLAPPSDLAAAASIVDLSLKRSNVELNAIASMASAKPLPMAAVNMPVVNMPAVIQPPPAHAQSLMEVDCGVVSSGSSSPSLLPPSKYQQLLQVIEEMGREVRPVYAGSKTAAEKLKKNIALARLLVKEALIEMDRAARHDK